MTYAYAGTILHVDLTEMKVWKEKLDQELACKYLGSRGINARLLWEKVKPGTDPLGPENVLIFGSGALGGTHAPSSGRTTVTCKSPATGRYLKTNGGGYFGVRLKFAGYDQLVIYGAAEKPVYVWIDDDKIEIRDASPLWGLSIPEADRALKEQLGAHDFETAAIGPAGENKVIFASIMLSNSFAAGRGGAGAVMGSKNLKAIAVRGSGAIKVADGETFNKVAMETRAALTKDPFVQGLHAFGTAGFAEALAATGALVSYNFQKGSLDGFEKITGQALVKEGFLQGRMGCASCAINCHRYSVVSTGRYAGTRTAGPEVETIAALGSGCGVTDIEAILKAAALCNDYGMDTISTGSVIQWTMESLDRGALSYSDLDGLELKWGNGDALVEMVRKIACREGIGDLLAEGIKIASEKTGKDSYKWAVQARGLEQSCCEVRPSKGYALAFCVNSRGPDHLFSQPIAEFGMTQEARDLIKQIAGDEKYANPTLTEKRPEIIRWHEDCYAATDCLGFCSFTTTAAYCVTPEIMAQLFSSGTGLDITEAELLTAGERIVNLERAFNMREGFDRKDDLLPYRMMNDPIAEGPLKGFVNSREELDGMVDEYFKLRGWNLETGCPEQAVLEKLGLEDVAEVLYKK